MRAGKPPWGADLPEASESSSFPLEQAPSDSQTEAWVKHWPLVQVDSFIEQSCREWVCP